jgi:hypothetical protein
LGGRNSEDCRLCQKPIRSQLNFKSISILFTDWECKAKDLLKSQRLGSFSADKQTVNHGCDGECMRTDWNCGRSFGMELDADEVEWNKGLEIGIHGG